MREKEGERSRGETKKPVAAPTLDWPRAFILNIKKMKKKKRRTLPSDATLPVTSLVAAAMTGCVSVRVGKGREKETRGQG